MRTSKSRKNDIVYVVPPHCVKFLKHKTPKCSSIKELPESVSESRASLTITSADDTGISDWTWGLNPSTSPPDTTQPFHPTVLSSPKTDSTGLTPAYSISEKTKITPTTSKHSTSTTKSTPHGSETIKNTPSTTSKHTSTSKFTPHGSSRSGITKITPSTTLKHTTSTLKPTLSSITETSPITSQTPELSFSTPSHVPLISDQVSTTYEPLTTEKPIVLTTASTRSSTTESSKCLEWYNKIKDQSPITEKPSFLGNCSKWYDIIKDDNSNVHKSACYEKKPKKPEVQCRTSALQRIDRWLDQRTGIEFLEPVFPSDRTLCEKTLNNPLIHFMANRQISHQSRDVFDEAIVDKLKKLKWLSQRITHQYRLLSEIENANRTGKSFGNVSKIGLASRKVGARRVGKSTRAQRFRDEFIKKKMQRVSNDKNDGWWKNFNAKIYAVGGYRNVGDFNICI